MTATAAASKVNVATVIGVVADTDDVHIVVTTSTESNRPEHTIDVYIDRARWEAVAQESRGEYLQWEIERLTEGSTFGGYAVVED